MVSVSDGVLAAARTAAASALPDTCTIQTRTNATDALGETVVTWAATYTSVPCRVDPVRASERVAAARDAAEYDFTLTLPWSQTVDATMRVVHGGLTYEVVGVDADKSWAVTRRAQLRRAV